MSALSHKHFHSIIVCSSIHRRIVLRNKLPIHLSIKVINRSPATHGGGVVLCHYTNCFLMLVHLILLPFEYSSVL